MTAIPPANQTPIAIEAVGMVSALGLSATASCAAVRAGIMRNQDTRFNNRGREPVVAAAAPEASGNWQGAARLAELARLAIIDCLADSAYGGSGAAKVPPVLIVTPGRDRPDGAALDSERLVSLLRQGLGDAAPEQCTVLALGRAGVFKVIEKTRSAFAAGRQGACLIVATDSLVNARALGWLEEGEHLKSDDNSDGVIPGEAAVALRLTSVLQCPQPRLLILGLGFANEPSAIETDTPNRSHGLALAIRLALSDASIAFEECDFRVGDVRGERLQFMEASTAISRLQRTHKDQFELWLPAENFGDIGVALPAANLAVTAASFQKGYAPGGIALLFASSDGTERAACIAADPRRFGRG